jgi:CubicO group peptidase (beta-lactamase class C family)
MKKKIPRKFIFVVTILYISVGCLFAQGNFKGGKFPSNSEGSAELVPLLEEIRKEYNLPAVAAAVVSADKIFSAAAVGVRVVGKENRVTVTDRFHIGSTGKSMTATMIASLVEKGKISWDTTPADVFPELKDQIHPSLRAITIEQLLLHRAGIQPFEADEEVEKAPKFTGTPKAVRRAFAGWLLRRGATSTVGEHVYSNAGYGLAAAIAERATGKTWESLMQKELFNPTGIKTGGFGWAARLHPNEPWGHQNGDPSFIPHPPNDEYQLKPYIAPAGDIHISIIDFALYIQLHLAGLNGQAKFLKPATFEKLHKPIGEYALGWNAQVIQGLPASTHSGSAGTFYAGVIIYPKKNIAVVIAINASGKGVNEARNKLFGKLMRTYKAIE